MVTATPTANNVMVMAELAGDSKQLAECILMQYLVSPLVMPLWLSLFVLVAVSH